MATLDEHIAGLEATDPEGAKALRAEVDAERAKARDADKLAKKHERDAAKYKGDLDGASKGTDEAVKVAQKERDDAKAEAQALADTLASTKMRHAIERKLGLADDAKGKRAAKAFLEDYAADLTLDDDGTVSGLDAAIERARKAEPFLFGGDEDEGAAKKPGGARAGSGPTPGKVAGKKTPTEREKIDAEKERRRAALPAPKKKGT